MSTGRREWLGSQSGKPFFLWVHVFDPHLPYDPPAPFREKYPGRPYDGEVAYTDQQLGRLFDAVARKSPPGNTLIAVLSDHGESFSEHGEYTHGVFLYDSTLRIPFLMAGPGIPAGVRVKQQARTIDLLPTLLELIGRKAPPGLRGPVWRPPSRAKRFARLFLCRDPVSQAQHGLGRAAGHPDQPLEVHPRAQARTLRPGQDPAETTNVIASHPAEVKELEAQPERRRGKRRSEKVEPAAVDQRTLRAVEIAGLPGRVLAAEVHD